MWIATLCSQGFLLESNLIGELILTTVCPVNKGRAEFLDWLRLPFSSCCHCKLKHFHHIQHFLLISLFYQARSLGGCALVSALFISLMLKFSHNWVKPSHVSDLKFYIWVNCWDVGSHLLMFYCQIKGFIGCCLLLILIQAIRFSKGIGTEFQLKE